MLFPSVSSRDGRGLHRGGAHPDLREQYKLFPKAMRGKHCISLRDLAGEEHPLPDPTYRVQTQERKRAHAFAQASAKRERNRGQEKRKRFNNSLDNQESQAFLTSMQRPDPLYPAPCSSGLRSASSWSPQEGLDMGSFGQTGGVKSGQEYEWVLLRPYPAAVVTRSNCPPLSRRRRVASPSSQRRLAGSGIWRASATSFRAIHFIHLTR